MANTPEAYGLPVVTAETIFDCLRSVGNKRRKPIGGGVRAGKTRSVIFALVPPHDSMPPDDLVLVSWERKRGADILVYPSFLDRPSEEDRVAKDPMAACAARAFEEETGIPLGKIWVGEKLLSMGNAGGVPVGWGNSQRYLAYCGRAAEPMARREPKSDGKKKMPLVLVPLTEWLKLVCSRDAPDGFAVGDGAISVTFLGLQRLRRFPLYANACQPISPSGEESREEDETDPPFTVHLQPLEPVSPLKITAGETKRQIESDQQKSIAVSESALPLWTAAATAAVIFSLTILLTVWVNL